MKENWAILLQEITIKVSKFTKTRNKTLQFSSDSGQVSKIASYQIITCPEH